MADVNGPIEPDPAQGQRERHGCKRDQHEHPWSVRVSQERLGMMLSLSRQTMNELLRHLEKESIIHCQRGGVRILDPSRLRDAARVPRKARLVASCN
jgi:CRP-like cAMP-binding protein